MLSPTQSSSKESKIPVEKVDNTEITKNQFTADTPESAAEECKNKVSENKKIFEQSVDAKLRLNPKVEARRAEADCTTSAIDIHDNSNAADERKHMRIDTTEENGEKDSQDISKTKEYESSPVEIASDKSTYSALQHHYEQIKVKVSEALEAKPSLKDILQAHTLLSGFQQAIETHSEPVENILEDVSARFSAVLEFTEDLLESIKSLKNTADSIPCLSIVLNRHWISGHIEDITKLLRGSDSSIASNETEFLKKMTKHQHDIRQMTKDFLDIVKENTSLENFHFGYKISDQFVSNCAEPLYVELTNSSHKTKQIVLPRCVTKHDITASSTGSNELTLEWTLKQNPTNALIVGYEIHVKRDGGNVVKTIRVESETQKYIVGELEENSGYQFGIVPVCEFNIRLPPYEFSESFKTKKKEAVEQSSHEELAPTEKDLVSPPSADISRLILVDKNLRKATNGTRWYTAGEKGNETLPEKVLLVVGGTGCGKSTLINALTNYLKSVQFEDAHRYKTITEEDESNESGTTSAGRSKTKFVSAYEFGAAKDLPYRLTVVDTPGFGDTEGIDKDRRTIAYIKEWFSQEQKKISAVCIVIKYNETRIKAQVQYELHSVISLFGKNVENNVFILFTFCDGSTPPTIAALKEIKLPVVNATFNINSSAVLTLPSERKMENEDDLIIAKYYWKMSMESFERFFDVLKTVEDETLSVSLTVLRKREILDALVRQIPFYVKRIDFLVDIAEQIKAQREAIDSGQQPLLQLTEFSRIVVRDGKTQSRNCRNCNMTCHKDCGDLDPLIQRHSCLMLVDESSDLDNATDIISTDCQFCGCGAEDHELQDSFIEMKAKREEIAASDVLKKFSTTSSASSRPELSSSALLHCLVDQLNEIDTQFHKMLQRIDKIEKDLANASLGASHQKTATGRLEDEAISEKQSKSTGYRKRMQTLERHKEALGHLAEQPNFEQHWRRQLLEELYQPLIGSVQNSPNKISKTKKKDTCVVL